MSKKYGNINIEINPDVIKIVQKIENRKNIKNFDWADVEKDMKKIINKNHYFVAEEAILACEDAPIGTIDKVVFSTSAPQIFFSLFRNPQINGTYFGLDYAINMLSEKSVMKELKDIFEHKKAPFNESVINKWVQIKPQAYNGFLFRFLKGDVVAQHMLEEKTLNENARTNLLFANISEDLKYKLYYAGISYETLDVRSLELRMIPEVYMIAAETFSSIENAFDTNTIKYIDTSAKILCDLVKYKMLTAHQEASLYAKFIKLTKENGHKAIKAKEIINNLIRYTKSNVVMRAVEDIAIVKNDCVPNEVVYDTIFNRMDTIKYNKTHLTQSEKILIYSEIAKAYNDGKNKLPHEAVNNINIALIDFCKANAEDYDKNKCILKEIARNQYTSPTHLNLIKNFIQSRNDIAGIKKDQIIELCDLNLAFKPLSVKNVFKNNVRNALFHIYTNPNTAFISLPMTNIKNDLIPVLEKITNKNNKLDIQELIANLVEYSEDNRIYNDYPYLFNRKKSDGEISKYTLNIENFAKDFETKKERFDFFETLSTPELHRFMMHFRELPKEIGMLNYYKNIPFINEVMGEINQAIAKSLVENKIIENIKDTSKDNIEI